MAGGFCAEHSAWTARVVGWVKPKIAPLLRLCHEGRATV